MRDREIRARLLDTLHARYPHDRIRSEVGLCLGATRVDVAMVNGHLHGFEIKSEKDSLARLATQVTYYGRVLDYATVVSSGRHVARVCDVVPAWWGVNEAFEDDGAVCFRAIQQGSINPAPDPLAIAQLLWRDEAAALLEARGETVRRRETRWDLWDRLSTLPLHEVQRSVRDTLKARPYWPGG